MLKTKKFFKVADHSEMDIDKSALMDKSNITHEWTLVTTAFDRLIFIIFTLAFSIIMIEITQFPYYGEYVDESKIVDIYRDK